jgi:2-hydroxy-3-keto-5-methylthiopentenyl-1-phosphate phosphatase
VTRNDGDPRVAVFVDYDGTITDRDTFDLLVQRAAGRAAWLQLEEQLHGRSQTLREVLAAQASLIRGTLAEADAIIADESVFDPHFTQFVEACEAAHIPLLILSSGVAPLIDRALARNGLAHVAVRANDVEIRAEGWRIRFRDGSDNGHDKAAAVREAKESGFRTIYIGDGFSDFDAAIEADVRFAKRGRSLEAHLRHSGLPFTPFDSFDELFPALGTLR